MEEWVKIAAQYGFGGIMLLLAVIGIRYGLWPFLKGLIETSQVARREDQLRFEEALARKDALIERIVERHEKITDKQAGLLTSLTDEFKSLRMEIKNHHQK